MARGQTQYYGLSQWEAADKVERVDFNSDNAKIDGATEMHHGRIGRAYNTTAERIAGTDETAKRCVSNLAAES